MTPKTQLGQIYKSLMQHTGVCVCVCVCVVKFAPALLASLAGS